MRKVFVAIVVMFVLVVFASVQSFSAPKGPKDKPVGGTVLVYDANDQFLGILLGYGHESLAEIFIPTANYTIFIRQFSGDVDFNDQHNWIYESYDCSGKPLRPLIFPMPYRDVIYHNKHNGGLPYKYYVIKSRLPQIDVTAYSETDRDDGSCIPIPEGKDYTSAVEITEIPETDIPFTNPVALPLRYELQ